MPNAFLQGQRKKKLYDGVSGIDEGHVVDAYALRLDGEGHVVVAQPARAVGARHEAQRIQRRLQLGGGAHEHVHLGGVFCLAQD